MHDVTPDNGQWNGHWHSPPPWHGQPGPRDDVPSWVHHTRRWRNRGDGEPLRRDPDDRLAGGIAAGLAAWRGFNPTTVRIVLAVAVLASAGRGGPLFLLGLALIPGQGGAR